MSNRIMEPQGKTSSNRTSSTSSTEKRLTDLEIKATFTEDLLDQLEKVITGQQKQIDLMVRELRDLRQRLPDQNDNSPRNPPDDRPPHF
jgi:SlyX protein